MNWEHPQISALIRLAVSEDQGRQDITSLTLISSQWRVRAVVRAKQAGVFAGGPLAMKFFKAFDDSLKVQVIAREGKRVGKGEVLLSVEGGARSVLAGERPALNALQHLSGIATYTASQVKRLGKTKTQLFDTRKTIPGWRLLEKHAVQCGGGTNHRMSLADAVLVKDNHWKIVRAVGFDALTALRKLKKTRPGLPIELEVQTGAELRAAIDIKPDFILLDNLSPRKLRSVIQSLKRRLPTTRVEISGGVSPKDLRWLGRLGAARISMGKLTHSAPAFDCSLDIVRVDAG